MEYYYTVTTEMTNTLHLKSNNLLVYAIIKAHATGFYGSRSHLAALTGSTLRTVDNSIKYLLDRKLISRKSELINNQLKITYFVNDNKDFNKDSLLKYIIKDLSTVSQEMYCKDLKIENNNILTLVFNTNDKNELISNHLKYFQRQVEYWNIQHKTNYKLKYEYLK